MYTILITKDNTVIATEKEAIMEKSSLVDTLQFLVEKEYNGFDMAEFQLVIQGYLPISHEIQVEQLELVDNNYKDLYYAYQLPVHTGITKEPGNLLYSLSFIKSEIDPNTGKVTNYVRNIAQGDINIHPISNWFAPPDTALTQLNQILLANQQAISALRNVANQIQDNAPEDIIINSQTEEIYLTNDGKRVGIGITLSNLDAALDKINEEQERTINIDNVINDNTGN